MSWLESIAPTTETSEQGWAPTNGPLQAFLAATVVVERDLDTGDLVEVVQDGHRWIRAWANLAMLLDERGAPEVDHAQMRGRQLRPRLPIELGILWVPARDHEIAIVWPQAAPVSRVAVQ